MAFQSTIFSYFGSYEANTDTYRDANGKGVLYGKGVLERFNEVIGKDMDGITQAIESMQNHYLNINTADLFTLKLICVENGVPYELLYSGSDISTIRRIAKYAKSIIEWKGSLNGVKLITYLILPPTLVAVIEDFSDYTFDSPIKLDNAKRKLDSGSNFTQLIFDYDNSLLVSNEHKDTLRKITAYNTPFDCISRTRLNGIFI